MSSSQQHKTNRTPTTDGEATSESAVDVNPTPVSQVDDLTSSDPGRTPRNSLTVADLAALGASNTSTSVFQRNAVRTLRAELGVDSVLIIDYIDAFGGKIVRAVSGIESVEPDSELWLPNWLSPVDVNSPIKLVDVDPSQFTSISALGVGSEYRSALALAIPGITGAVGMIVALSRRSIEFDASHIDKAKIIVSLLSLSASRSNAVAIAERDESQLAASRLITRSNAIVASEENDTGNPESLLINISNYLQPFFEFDVIAIRVLVGGEFTTRDVLSLDPHADYSIPASGSGLDAATGAYSIESRASDLAMAITNSPRIHEPANRNTPEPAWKAAGIKSVLAIPVIGTTGTVVVLGSKRTTTYTPEAVTAANRFIPAITAALGGSIHDSLKAVSRQKRVSKTPDYIESIASANELVSACGVIATQIANRTGASRVQIGFLDEETGRSYLGFDTEPVDGYIDHGSIAPDEIEHLTEAETDQADGQQFLSIRTALIVSERTIGFVEATSGQSGFDAHDIAQIKEITAACSQVVATLKQLEQAQSTLIKLDMLRRVTEQIRSDSADNPISSPRIASLIRNLFEADWIYFGSVDHENDHSTTEITDGLDVPELAPGVRVSRRSLLIPSTLTVSSPVIIDLESAAPGQRAAGRWMYRAGLRSAVCAPLRLNGVVSTVFMCASRKPMGFGNLEKKMAAAITSELEIAIERTQKSPVQPHASKGSVETALKQPVSNLETILNRASVLVMTVDRDGIVTEVAGRGIEGLKLVPERLLGRDFIAYSRKIDGLEESLSQALNGSSSRIEIEIFGTILDAQMEPNLDESGEAVSVTIIVSDVTDRVIAARTESALQRIKEEKDRANKFIVSLSHEMKSPLTTVVALADLLGLNDRGNLHPDQIERINVVQQNADRLTLLVNDFLNISKMQAGTFESKPSKFQIAELARDLETSFEPIATVHDQLITVTVPDEHQFATADRELLRQAIMNLLTNASKYSPPKTNVSLDIWVDERDLRITVTDEGSGIPHGERDSVFEPYSQLSNHDIQGTGMGLAIVQQIVELHHGKVWVEDGVGGGTSFAIWLPEAVSGGT